MEGKNGQFSSSSFRDCYPGAAIIYEGIAVRSGKGPTVGAVLTCSISSFRYA